MLIVRGAAGAAVSTSMTLLTLGGMTLFNGVSSLELVVMVPRLVVEASAGLAVRAAVAAARVAARLVLRWVSMVGVVCYWCNGLTFVGVVEGCEAGRCREL